MRSLAVDAEVNRQNEVYLLNIGRKRLGHDGFLLCTVIHLDNFLPWQLEVDTFVEHIAFDFPNVVTTPVCPVGTVTIVEEESRAAATISTTKTTAIELILFIM